MARTTQIPHTTTARAATASLGTVLFSGTQRRVLGLLFGQPERSFYATELIARAGVGSGGVQRELAKLTASGLVTVLPVGNQRHYQANAHAPIFEELCSIVRKTFGLATPLQEALAPLADQIALAFVFGSVAKRQDAAASDIDLLLVSDTLGYADCFHVLEPVTQAVGRTVNPQIYTTAEWRNRLSDGDSFATRIVAQPKIWLMGDEHGIAL
ncbi:MarR family transcriptional regulator [Xylophilus ampelinus]|uniref:MarR family protein n=1 Tax=Xylophilus ampelinus TaxID=54067 RepID=A0A318SM70_9BURK|nr:MarR family transcriptional regulator [Xylophilus ampelinus]MCS4510028.1 MarR family transcriptional regulator [Xylophilus ampelinus]PYE78392.1 MarR family protein [Xylophilus ampelinus]